MAGIGRFTGGAGALRANRLVVVLCSMVLGSLAFTSSAAAVSQSWVANLSSSQEVPTNGSTAGGFGTVVLNAAETQITVNLSFAGLTSNAAAMHIHGSARPGVNAGVLFGLSGFPAATSGSSTPDLVFAVTPAQVTALRKGQMYFNVHSVNLPGGEIRGQIVTGVSQPGVVAQSINWSLGSSLSHPSADITFTFGARPNVPFVCDLDGNGSETPVSYEAGVFKVSNGYAGGVPDSTITFGDTKGFPLGGDFDGDAKDDLAVYRNGTWNVRFTDDGATDTFTFGSGSWPDTIPVTGDWNGDGLDGIGTYTRSTATWNLRETASAGAPDIGPFVFGTPSTSYPVVGDWNFDNTETIGVKTGTAWSRRNTNTAGSSEGTFFFGQASNHPFTWRGP